MLSSRRITQIEEKTIMRYLLLIYTNETEVAQAPQAEHNTMDQEYFAFGEAAREQIAAGEALLPTSAATTVRVRDGEALIVDGPFAETKEQLGGFYLVNCENLDGAIALAKQIPGARRGSIEIRPIMEFN
jgi:hypothetical protein